MPALDRIKPIECDKCGKRIVRKNISRQTKEKLDYHDTKKHCKEGLTKKLTCTECMLTFYSFYALLKRKQTLHVSQSQSNVTLSGEVDLDTIMGNHANQQLRAEFRNVEHFLDNLKSFRGKHVFNFASLELSPAVMAGKLRLVFANL